MTKSPLFHTKAYQQVEADIKKFLNGQPDFLNKATATSTRAAGDALQSVLADHFQELLGKHSGKYSKDFARRAMVDLAFEDSAGAWSGFQIMAKPWSNI